MFGVLSMDIASFVTKSYSQPSSVVGCYEIFGYVIANVAVFFAEITLFDDFVIGCTWFFRAKILGDDDIVRGHNFVKSQRLNLIALSQCTSIGNKR